MSTVRVNQIEASSEHDYNIEMDATTDINVAGTYESNPSKKLVIPSGTEAQRPGTPQAGMMRHNTESNAAEVYDGTNWIDFIGGDGIGSAAVTGDGSSEANAAFSATALKQQYPNTPSGAYYYKIPGTNRVKRLWTDFTYDGGNWVIVSKWGGHSKNNTNVYSAAERSVSNLASSAFDGYGDYSRLSRDDMNAIWQDSRFVVRIHFKNDDYTNTSGIYFQKKLNRQREMDFWRAHYHPLQWSNGNSNSYQATGGGTHYQVSFAVATTSPEISNYTGTNNFQPATDNVAGGSGYNNNMGWWDRGHVTAPDFGVIEISRHMGFFGDIDRGNQWIFTGSTDSRFNNNENRRSIVLLRW
jgi:hypothetical protein